MKKITKILAVIMSGALLVSSAMIAAFMETDSIIQNSVTSQFEAGAETVYVEFRLDTISMYNPNDEVGNKIFETATIKADEYISTVDTSQYTEDEIEKMWYKYRSSIITEMREEEYEKRVCHIADVLGMERDEIVYQSSTIYRCTINAEQAAIIEEKLSGSDYIRWVYDAEIGFINPNTTPTYIPEITTTPSVSILAGDANGNFSLDIGDVVKIMYYVTNAEAYPLTVYELENADVYCKGDGVNNMDALSVQKKLAGLISELPESY